MDINFKPSRIFLLSLIILFWTGVTSCKHKTEVIIEKNLVDSALSHNKSQKQINQLVYRLNNVLPENEIKDILSDTSCFLSVTEVNLDSDRENEIIFELGENEDSITILIVKRVLENYKLLFRSTLRYPQVSILTKPEESKTILIKYQYSNESQTDNDHVIILNKTIHMYKFLRLTNEKISFIDVPEQIKYFKSGSINNSEIIAPYFSNRDKMLAVTYYYDYKLDPSKTSELSKKFSKDWLYTPYFNGVTTLYINWDSQKNEYYLHDDDLTMIDCFLNPDNLNSFFKAFSHEIEAKSQYGNQFQKEVCKFIIKNK